MDLLVAVIIFWLGTGICKDDSTGKVLYRKTLGRPATLGMLYSAHSDNFIPGFGFWEENDIKENKQIVCHGSAKTTLAYDQTQDQKRFLLDVKAELEISVKANIPIEVWGSAGYLKHEEDLSSTATVTLLYESITKTEAISTYLTNKLANSDQTAQACNWDKDGDVPTHVVSSVTYGGDAVIQFERFIQDIDDSEEIHGALRIAIDLEAFSITGSASVDHEDKKISHLTDTKIFTFTDFIIPEQPTSLEDTIKLYKEISTYLGTKEDNFASSVPMSVTLIPLKRFCPETNQLAEEIASHVMKIATDIRLELLDTDKKIAKFLSKRVAMENFRVKQLLLDFQEELSNYTLSYEKKLQKMIIEARNPLKKTNENDLAELVISYKNSDFNFPIFLFGYLTQREREINAIDVLYLETVKKKEPQIAAYKAAKIPFALITGRRVFIVTLKVLPNFQEEKYSRYVEHKKKGIFGEKSSKKWFNDFNLVGAIGKLWTAYKTFFEYNSYKAGDSFHVNLLEAESDNPYLIATLRLYVYGEEQEGFKIPVQPEKPSVCRKEQNRKIVVKVKNPPELPGPSVIKSILVEILLAKSHIRKKSQIIKTEHAIAKHDNETTILITKLEPEETYNITVSYVTEFGRGEPSDVVQAIGTLDNMMDTDGCLIDNDEKFKNGIFHDLEDETVIECARLCAKNKTNVGWSYEFSTKSCFISSVKYTENITNENTNETKTVDGEDKEFKLGWASGTLACSRASDVMTSCSKDDDGINAFLVTGGFVNETGAINSGELVSLGSTSVCPIPKLPDPIYDHVTFVTGDGILASCGGSTSANETSDKCVVFDIGKGVWEENNKKVSNLPKEITRAMTATLPAGVYILGETPQGMTSHFLPSGLSQWLEGPENEDINNLKGACVVNTGNNFLVIGGSYTEFTIVGGTKKCKEGTGPCRAEEPDGCTYAAKEEAWEECPHCELGSKSTSCRECDGKNGCEPGKLCYCERGLCQESGLLVAQLQLAVQSGKETKPHEINQLVDQVISESGQYKPGQFGGPYRPIPQYKPAYLSCRKCPQGMDCGEKGLFCFKAYDNKFSTHGQCATQSLCDHCKLCKDGQSDKPCEPEEHNVTRKDEVSFSNKVHLFDPERGPTSDLGWRKWAPIRQGRSHHACAILSNKVIVAGGYGKGYDILKSTEIMDLNTQSVISGTNLEVARVHFGMVTVGDAENQMVLAFGGQTEEGDIHPKFIEKMKNDRWEIERKELAVPRHNFGFLAVNVKSICSGAPIQNNMNKTDGACSHCHAWTEWKPCNMTCGPGTRTRTRSCIRERGEEDSCQCMTKEEKDCNNDPCPVDGSWSGWSSFSACSSRIPYTCGSRSRSRMCNNPVASLNGKKCEGRDIDFVGCSGGEKLPLRVTGHCQETKGNDMNSGQEALPGCFPTPKDCLQTCQENTTATGCEYNTLDKNCYIHTAHLTGVNENKGSHICWLFVVDELPGSCTNDLTAITVNITSEVCLEKCQEEEAAQGCQYNIVKEECSYFTCPMASTDNNKNITCWTFNKGIFNGDLGGNCGPPGL